MTRYAMIGILSVVSFLSCSNDDENSNNNNVNLAPVPGNAGELTVGDITATSITLSWQAASDDNTSTQNLEYQVVYATDQDISTVELIEDHASVAVAWSNITTATISGLQDQESYHCNVLVRDEQGLRAVYSETVVNIGDLTPPIAIFIETPDDSTTDIYATFVVGGTDVEQYRYQIDGSSWSSAQAVSESIVLTDLVEGLHSISLVGADAAGNWQLDTDATVFTWLIDILPSYDWITSQVMGPYTSFRGFSFDDGEYQMYLYGYSDGNTLTMTQFDVADGGNSTLIDTFDNQAAIFNVKGDFSETGIFCGAFIINYPSGHNDIYYVEKNELAWSQPLFITTKPDFIRAKDFLVLPDGSKHMVIAYDGASFSYLEHIYNNGTTWETEEIDTLQHDGQDDWRIRAEKLWSQGNELRMLYSIQKYDIGQELYFAMYDGDSWSGTITPVDEADNAGGGGIGSGFSFGPEFVDAQGNLTVMYMANYRSVPPTSVEPDSYLAYFTEADGQAHDIEPVAYWDNVYFVDGVYHINDTSYMYYEYSKDMVGYKLDSLKMVSFSQSQADPPVTMLKDKYKIYTRSITDDSITQDKQHIMVTYHTDDAATEACVEYISFDGSTWVGEVLMNVYGYYPFNSVSSVIQENSGMSHVFYIAENNEGERDVVHAYKMMNAWQQDVIDSDDLEYIDNMFQSSDEQWYVLFRSENELGRLSKIDGSSISFAYIDYGSDTAQIYETSEQNLHLFCWSDSNQLLHYEFRYPQMYAQMIDDSFTDATGRHYVMSDIYLYDDHFYLVNLLDQMMTTEITYTHGIPEPF